MGIYKEERGGAKQDAAAAAITKAHVSCLWPFLVSMIGGLVLWFWDYKYHSTYRQLWMVPFGLILFITPAIILFAVFVSELCMLDEEHVWRSSRSVGSLGDSLHDPEK